MFKNASSRWAYLVMKDWKSDPAKSNFVLLKQIFRCESPKSGMGGQHHPHLLFQCSYWYCFLPAYFLSEENVEEKRENGQLSYIFLTQISENVEGWKWTFYPTVMWDHLIRFKRTTFPPITVPNFRQRENFWVGLKVKHRFSSYTVSSRCLKKQEFFCCCHKKTIVFLLFP